MAWTLLDTYDLHNDSEDIIYTLPDGVNRLVLLVIGFKDDAELGLGTATLDGTAFTLARASDWSADHRRAEVYYMLEADLPADDGDYTISFSSDDEEDVGICVTTYSGIKQEAPEATDKRQHTLERYPWVEFVSTTGALVCMASAINNTGIGVLSYEFDTVKEQDMGLVTSAASYVGPVFGENRRWNIDLQSNAYNTMVAGASFAIASDEENHPIKVLQVQLGAN